MIVQLAIIFIILVLGRITPEENRRDYIICISILLILQSGLRNWAVGADTYQYYRTFETVKSYTWPNIQQMLFGKFFLGIGKDPGYIVFQKIVQYALPYYQPYLLLIAVIFFSSLGYFIYKNTSSISDVAFAYVLYSCLFYAFFSITGQRQTIATAASLYGFELIKKRKLFQFIVIILLASTIHKSVLIVLPFYFFSSIKATKFFFSGILILFPLLIVFRQPIITVFALLGGYQDFLLYSNEKVPYTFTIMLFLVAVVALWRMKIVLQQNFQARQFYNAFIFAIFFAPLMIVNPSVMRVVQYYSIFMLVLLPAVFNSFEIESRNVRKLVTLTAITMLIGLFISTNLKSEYKFFWQKMELGRNYMPAYRAQ